MNATKRDVGIETFYLPAGSISINPGTEGGAVGWKSPMTGSIRIAGKLTDGDPHDGAGISWVLDHESGAAERYELSSGRLTKDGGAMCLEEGRLASRLNSVAVKAGDWLYLHAQLGEGDAHYDITNVELTISRTDGQPGEWSLASDVRNDMLAGNPHADSQGNANVWHFYDAAGSRRLGRMPSADALLQQVWLPAIQVDRAAVESAARKIEQAVVAAGEAGPLAQDLAGPQSPFWAAPRDDARYLPEAAQKTIAKLSSELDALKGQTPNIAYAHGVAEGGLRYGPSPGFGDAPIHVRGDYTQLGATVPRRFPVLLEKMDQPPIRSGSGRLELAQWVASANNPLTTRVMVNRIWQHHFGRGIVRTPSNFGRLGEAPTHPELLDYLARQFIESGWSVKHMHRLIMLSATYSQASVGVNNGVRADPDNRLLGRMNRRRLEAEAVRDSLLVLADRLEDRTGGPANAAADSARRLIYRSVSRSDRSDFGSLFDRANPALHVDERTVSTAAAQALHLMNGKFVLDQATALADRPEVAGETDPARRIDKLYHLVLARPATAEEIALGRDFIDAAAAEVVQTPDAPSPWARYAHALLLSNEFLFVD